MIGTKSYRRIPFRKRDRCVVCGIGLSRAAIELPDFPLSEIYVKEPVADKVAVVDQAFHLCASCGHGQLANVIEPHVLYDDSYATRTSTSPSAVGAIDVFLQFVDDVLEDRPVKTIVDIGCNDVYMLKRLETRADRLYGIDPILKGRQAESEGNSISLIGALFEDVDLAQRGIELDLVLSSHTLEHVPDPTMLLKRLMDLATPESVFVFQFPALELLVNDARFDQIHHQHVNYFTLQSTIRILENVGAELTDFRFNPDHWGALMVAFRKSRGNVGDAHARFRSSIVPITRERVARQFAVFKISMDAANARIASYDMEPVYGYGAALMLPVLNYYVPAVSSLSSILDEDDRKCGMYYINLPVRIVPPANVPGLRNSVVVVTAIHSKQVVRAITAKLIAMKVREIVIPSNTI